MNDVRLIDANALIKTVEQAEGLSWDSFDRQSLCVRRKFIDNAPTVEYPFYKEAYQTGYEEGKNDRPHGKWIGVVYSDNRLGVGMCNQCGVNRIIDNFCSNCGADMRDNDDENY